MPWLIKWLHDARREPAARARQRTGNAGRIGHQTSCSAPKKVSVRYAGIAETRQERTAHDLTRHAAAQKERLLVTQAINAWMNGELVGQWRVDRQSHAFRYAPSWLESPRCPSRSLSLPISAAKHIEVKVSSFTSLLPFPAAPSIPVRWNLSIQPYHLHYALTLLPPL